MLRDQQGIHSVKVALLAERGVIEYDPNVWTSEKLINVSTTCFTKLQSSLTSNRKYPTLVSMRLSFRQRAQIL